MDNTLKGKIIKTEMSRNGLPYSSTYTITVDTIEGKIDVIIVDTEINLFKMFGIVFKGEECKLPDYDGRQCTIFKAGHRYFFNGFVEPTSSLATCY